MQSYKIILKSFLFSIFAAINLTLTKTQSHYLQKDTKTLVKWKKQNIVLKVTFLVLVKFPKMLIMVCKPHVQ